MTEKEIEIQEFLAEAHPLTRQYALKLVMSHLCQYLSNDSHHFDMIKTMDRYLKENREKDFSKWNAA